MDKIRLIASDMDATLLDEHSQLPPQFVQTVRALAQQDILFAAASGRPLYTLEGMFPSLLDTMILIGDNGGAVRWKGETLFVSEMPANVWRDLSLRTKQVGGIGVLCGLESAYIEQQYLPYDSVMRTFYTKVEYVDCLENVEARADKFTIYFPNNDSQEAFDTVYNPAFGSQYSVAVAGCNWIDVMNHGVHKGSALAEIGRRFHIPQASMMAFGDTFNDAEMLQTARYGFLMANGSEALRQKVPFLAPSNREHGVMQILARVLAQNGEVSAEDFEKAI